MWVCWVKIFHIIVVSLTVSLIANEVTVLITSYVGEGEIPCPKYNETRDTWHWDGKMCRSLLLTYAHSLGEEDMAHTQVHTGIVLGNRVNKQGLWEAGFAVSRSWGASLGCLLTGGCDCLAWITSWAGREIKPFRVRTRWNAAGPADRGLVGSGETFPLGGGISGRQENSCLDLGACEARRCPDGTFNFGLTVCWPSFQCLSVNYSSFSCKLPIYVF